MKALTVILLVVFLAGTKLHAHEEHDHATHEHAQHQHAPGPGMFGHPPEYVHVLLNPLPVYGLGIGVLALIAGLIARSKPARIIALGVIVISSASAWPVHHFGTNSYQHVRQISDEQGQNWLDKHMERAEKSLYVFYVTALLGIAGLISYGKFPRAALPLTITTLVASGLSLGIGG